MYPETKRVKVSNATLLSWYQIGLGSDVKIGGHTTASTTCRADDILPCHTCDHRKSPRMLGSLSGNPKVTGLPGSIMCGNVRYIGVVLSKRTESHSF